MYSLQLIKIEYDIKTAKTDKEKAAKITWKNEWVNSILRGLGKETSPFTITILLTQYLTKMASVLRFLTAFPYTHASIGLSEDRNTFYIFVKKGFIVEMVTRFHKPDRAPFPCALYELPVPEAVYHRIKAVLQAFETRKSELRYTHRSMLLSLLLYIPYERKDCYFCSHFVAEVLQRGNWLHQEKDSILYLPRDFTRLPGVRQVFRGDLLGLSRHYGLA